MKITLLGDFSALHKQLAVGFKENGADCEIHASGDGFKKTHYDKYFGNSKKGYINLAKYLFYDQPKALESIFKRSDVVQLINPYVLHVPNYVFSQYSNWLCGLIAKHKKDSIFSMVSAGCDARVEPFMRSSKYSACAGCLKDSGLTKCQFARTQNKKFEDTLDTQLDIVFPFGFKMYFDAYATKERPLPFPMVTDFPHSKNVVAKKIRVLHGINRAGFKGSEQIIKALNKIEQDYPNRVEVVIVRQLPLDEYLEVLMGVNVVVDQLFGGAFGMNALFSMAHGKITLCSYDSNWIQELYGQEPPALPVFSEADVYGRLLDIVGWDDNLIMQKGEQSREFVEKCCNPKTISGKMLARYENLLAAQ